MFKVVAERRKRSVWSPRTVAASVAVHLLLLAGFVTAAETREPPREEKIIDISLATEQPKIHRAEPTPPPPADRPDQPPPVAGRTLQLPAPTTVPPDLPPPNPNALPALAEQYTGEGPLGTVIGTPQPHAPTPPVGPPSDGGGNLPVFPAPMDVESVDSRPELGNRRQAEMILQNNYPPMLRDAGVTGRTTVELIIDKDGKVEPGSVRVKDSSDDAFNQAAIRAVERFRFKPAIYRGQPVAVLVTLPIEWQVAQ